MQAKLMRRISVPQQSIVAPHDVAHASVRSRPEIWKVVRAAMRFGDGRTHLACELCSTHPETTHGCGSRRVERRSKRWRYLGVFDARQEVEVATVSYISDLAPR
jgi:hypothetical protein